jgi:hypothetical protein
MIDARDDADQPGPAGAVDHAPQPELHPALVLLEDAHRQRREHKRHEQHDDSHIDDHVVSFSPATTARRVVSDTLLPAMGGRSASPSRSVGAQAICLAKRAPPH